MISLRKLINIDSVKIMAENSYAILGIPIGLINSDGTIEIAVGWQDICTKFHRQNKTSSRNCIVSDKYLSGHNNDVNYLEYKCLNGMREVALPIIISGVNVATLFWSVLL